MNKRNKEVDDAIKKRFGDNLSKPRHDERISNTDYWENMRGHEFEESRANPDQLFSTSTPWMTAGYFQQRERLEELQDALDKIVLRPKARQILNLFLQGHNQEGIATIVGVSQQAVSDTIGRIAKKLKKIMDGTL